MAKLKKETEALKVKLEVERNKLHDTECECSGWKRGIVNQNVLSMLCRVVGLLRILTDHSYATHGYSYGC